MIPCSKPVFVIICYIVADFCADVAFIGNICNGRPILIKYWLSIENNCDEILLLQNYRLYIGNICNETTILQKH